MRRIENKFRELKSRGEGALMPYIPGGYPNSSDSANLIQAICDAGADIIELGVPYADPLADGPTIQEANAQALADGANLDYCLDTVKSLRASGNETPIILMGYCNSFLAYGVERLAEEAANAGVDGFIVPDLPPNLAGDWVTALQAKNLDLSFLIAPTTAQSRMSSAIQNGTGFTYCISVNGVTGARKDIPKELPQLLEQARAVTDLPLCVGFGVSTPQQVSDICKFADGVVVGSALIDVIRKAPVGKIDEKVRTYVSGLKSATKLVAAE